MLNRLDFSMYFDNKIDELCDDEGFKIDSKNLLKLCKPCVYIFVGYQQEVLYVGFSSNGIQRIAQRDHGQAELRERCNHVLIYTTKTEEDARELETLLIKALRPTHNGKPGNKRVNPRRTDATLRQYGYYDKVKNAREAT